MRGRRPFAQGAGGDRHGTTAEAIGCAAARMRRIRARGEGPKHYVKELVLRNFAGVSAEQLLKRMIELSLDAEEKLRAG
jgi:hypothetical protein